MGGNVAQMRLCRKEREVLASRCDQREKELDAVHAGHKRALHKKQREIDAMAEELARAKDIQRELRVKVRDLTRCGSPLLSLPRNISLSLSRPAPSRGSTGLMGVSTRSAGMPQPWGATSCRKAAPLTYFLSPLSLLCV